MTEQHPLVSIVIPCYNHAQFVQETIQSVIDQDYENIELIIIDDGSDDNSVEVIQEMIPACEERFARFEFRYRPNKGLCATLNEALEWCEGEYFAPIASDDILINYKTRKQVCLFESEKDSLVVGVFGRVLAFDNKLNEIKNTDNVGLIKYNFEDVFYRRSKLPAPTAMLNTSKLKSVGGYDQKMKIEDFYLWLRLTEDGSKLLFANEYLAYYRRHSDNLSKKSNVMITGVMEVLDRYKNKKGYKEAVSRSYLVHAGDCVENNSSGGFIYLLKGIVQSPKLIFSKLFLIFFYRKYLGFKKGI